MPMIILFKGIVGKICKRSKRVSIEFCGTLEIIKEIRPDIFKGQVCNLVVLDESSKISKELLEELRLMTLPKKGKIIL